METTQLVVADRLSKWYGPRQAVADVTFSVAAGEVVGLLGPNGSGKTTILRILAGYLQPTGGTAYIDGVDVLRRPVTLRAEVGYVPEDAPLYGSMRVIEFLTFMAEVKGLRGRAAKAGVESVLERLRLGDVRRLSVAKLSHGYRQRVAVAQALVNDPKVLILDEPTNGLDPYQIIETRKLIRSLAGTQTVLVASHVLTEIEKTADRVIILLDGRVLAQQSLADNGHGRRFRLRVRGPAAAVRTCLQSVAGVVAVSLADDKGNAPEWTVETEPREGIAHELARAVIADGWALEELAEASHDLERLFLDLTRHRHGDSGP